jgi:hypothetical protein
MRTLPALSLVCALSLCVACGDVANPAVEKAVRCSKAASYAAAKRYSETADQAALVGDFETANRNAQAGIRAIGNADGDPSALDDTGVKETLAVSKERKGRIDHAAHLRLNVLETRLDSLHRGLAGCPRA